MENIITAFSKIFGGLHTYVQDFCYHSRNQSCTCRFGGERVWESSWQNRHVTDMI